MTEVLKVTITGADDDTIIFEGLPRDAYELLGKYIGKEPKIKWKTSTKRAYPMLNGDDLTIDMLEQAMTRANALYNAQIYRDGQATIGVTTTSGTETNSF